MSTTDDTSATASAGPVERVVRPRAWMAMAYGVPAQATTDEPTAIRWRKAGGDVRPLFEVEPLSDDAMRWRCLVRHASLGFDGAPSWNAVVRLPVFDSDDQTITALVDSARKAFGDA